MKKILKTLIASIIALTCVMSFVACDGSGVSGKAPGLHYKKTNDGVYEITKYVAEEGVTVLDIDTKLDAEITNIRIKKGAFSGNDTLTKIIVPARVTEIAEGAFEKMQALESLVLPFIGRTANSDAYLQETQTATDKSVNRARTIAHLFGTEEYDAGVGVTINYDSSNNVKVYMPRTFISVTVKAGAEYSIPMFAFNGALNLTSIVLDGNIDAIGVSAFAGCREIRSISLPASVKTIYENAFNGCVKLDQVIFATDSVLDTVKDGAFVATKVSRDLLDGKIANVDKDKIFGEEE